MLALIAAAAVASAPARAHDNCAPPGEWTTPGGGRIAAQEVFSHAARESVVLIGEQHDDVDHHRWQLSTIAGLAALHPGLVLGFEMFPRRVQGVLDRWVAGELSEQEFLEASDWSRVWGYDAAFYLPLFHFARINRVPMRALNVERELVRMVGAKGLEAVPVNRREGVTDPAPAADAYVDQLFAIYSEHPEKGGKPSRSDPEFGHFVEAQLIWDRAMAQALADAAERGALVIGVMGSGHIAQGHGVPHQLRSLGMTRVASLLPWEPNSDCQKITAGLATAVFGVQAAHVPPRPLLGITIDTVSDGVRVTSVRAGSIAEAAGLHVGDVLIEIAGSVVKVPAQVRAIVGAMLPGTWLPLKAKREAEILELTARFPPAGK